MLTAQENFPTKNDWYSEVQNNIKEFNINLSNSETKSMNRKQFHRITRQKSTEQAFQCLIQKKEKGKKGNILKYKNQLQMADYSCPNIFLDLEDQRLLFQIRSETNQLPANKGNPGPCPMDCGSLLLNNPHILQCSVLNTGEKCTYKGLVNENLMQMKKNLTIWRINMEKIEEMTALDSAY